MQWSDILINNLFIISFVKFPMTAFYRSVSTHLNHKYEEYLWTKSNFIGKPFRQSDRLDWFFLTGFCIIDTAMLCWLWSDIIELDCSSSFVILPDSLIKLLIFHYGTWALWLTSPLACVLSSHNGCYYWSKLLIMLGVTCYNNHITFVCNAVVWEIKQKWHFVHIWKNI